MCLTRAQAGGSNGSAVNLIPAISWKNKQDNVISGLVQCSISGLKLFLYPLIDPTADKKKNRKQANSILRVNVLFDRNRVILWLKPLSSQLPFPYYIQFTTEIAVDLHDIKICLSSFLKHYNHFFKTKIYTDLLVLTIELRFFFSDF